MMGPDSLKFKPGVYVKLEPAEEIKPRQIDCPAFEMPNEAFARLRRENRELVIELARTKVQLLLAQCKMQPQIENVIFNDPATVVFWADGSKTVVKCQPGDAFSKELGLAMAICKKVYGNKGNYNDVFKKWVPQDE